jgi:hypothetical protein
LPSFTKQFLRVLRPNGSFESVKDEKASFIRSAREPMNIQKITVRCDPALNGRRLFWFTAGEFPPKRLRVSARKPPGSVISCHRGVDARFQIDENSIGQGILNEVF